MICYHFTSDRLRDGTPIPPVGEWLEHDGPLVPCVSGLHGSPHPLDALTYAPGHMLHRVELDGEMRPHGEPVDKYVASRRRILASVDAESLLHEFARRCAASVLNHWDAPEVVVQYLKTGRESLRALAGSAGSSARSAGSGAAWSAWFATHYAAGSGAAWSGAAWSAWFALGSAARSAQSAAGSAAWSAEFARSRESQRTRLQNLVDEAFKRSA
jgi:hypothetical protein